MPTATAAKTLFAQITKINIAERKVSGIAMQETVDHDNECCDYEKSKPFFKAWSESQEKASGGKSKGNVREMHGNTAAGKVTELVCDDGLKAFLIDTYISDDQAWAKCEDGTYTGFSIGANHGEKPVMLDGVKWWVANPVEVSLVDRPCVPTALFTEVKADGTEVIRKFSNVIQPTQAKSMYSVREMADILSGTLWLTSDLEWEKEWEGDDSNIPVRLRDWLQTGVDIFVDLTEEETSEFAELITAGKAARAVVNKAITAGQAPTKTTKEKRTMANDTIDVTKFASADALKALTERLDKQEADRTAEKAAQTTKDEAAAATSTEILATLKGLTAKFTEFDGFVAALAGEEPEVGKTVHPASVTVPRTEADVAPVVKVVDASKQADRIEAMKGIYSAPASGSGFPTHTN